MRGTSREGLIRRISASVWLGSVLLASVAGLSTNGGCERGERSRDTLFVTPTAMRALRRAFDGAPPVIPHSPQRAACQVCHDLSGKEVPGLGLAPANPHHRSASEAAFWNCRQCHVFQGTSPLLTTNSLQGVSGHLSGGSRLYATAPPTIPHDLLLRDNCLGCHSGVAARPEIRCSHPERMNCVQCHVQGLPRNKE